MQTLTIQIPEPCGENFNKMTPVPGGRHCASCEKTVVDFRNYSDAEIGRYYKRHQGKVCGVFQEDQLNRAMVLPKDPSKLGKWKAVAAMLSGLAIGGTANAQQTMGRLMPTVQTTENVVVKKTVDTKKDSKILRGKVTDINGEGLIGATVVIKGTHKGTTTDFEGNFRLKIDSEFRAFEVVVSYLGYENLTQKMTFENVETKVFNFKLKESAQMLGEVVITGERILEHEYSIAGGISFVHAEEYVEEVKPEIPKKKEIVLTVSPNPFFDYLKVDFKTPVEDAYIFTLYTQMGQLVFAETQELTMGHQSVEIRPNKFDLPAGTYILNVTNEQGFSESTQVVKVK